MSRFFPHPPYAEDQPYGRTILTTHVLARGFTTGAGLGGATYLLRRAFRPSPSLSLLRSAGSGAIVGTGLLAVALVGRMRGREEIEWLDRSWRLLENRGQVETDDWVAVGTGAGVVGVLARDGLRTVGVRGLLGGAGLGSLVGMVGAAGWRYGVRGGKFEERSE
jgi:hypothetical protein